MNSDALKQRTKDFALRVIRMTRILPETAEAKVIANQLLRSATSTAANYRAACLARSRAEFVSKIGVVLEEADESLFWLELLMDAEVLPQQRLEALRIEASELAAIFAASRLTAGKQS